MGYYELKDNEIVRRGKSPRHTEELKDRAKQNRSLNDALETARAHESLKVTDEGEIYCSSCGRDSHVAKLSLRNDEELICEQCEE